MKYETLNIVVPMAGRGSRFSEAGFDLPKPLIPVRGRPMIEVVIENLRPSTPHRFIFICQKEHVVQYGLDRIVKTLSPTAEVIALDGITEGAACTVMMAERYIDNAAPLMIANCDQYVAASIDDYLEAMRVGEYDGYIMTMTANHPKWSFVRLDEHKRITEVVEKKVVSDEATVGIYNFARGTDFANAVRTMIAADERVNGEFYVAPAYNPLIAKGARVGYWNIGSDRAGMYGLGVPEDLQYFNALKSFP